MHKAPILVASVTLAPRLYHHSTGRSSASASSQALARGQAPPIVNRALRYSPVSGR